MLWKTQTFSGNCSLLKVPGDFRGLDSSLGLGTFHRFCIGMDRHFLSDHLFVHVFFFFFFSDRVSNGISGGIRENTCMSPGKVDAVKRPKSCLRLTLGELKGMLATLHGGGQAVRERDRSDRVE